MTAKGKQWAERSLRLDAIRERPEFQLRAGGVDRSYVKRLAQALRDGGEPLPRVKVAAIGNALYLVDGFHRKAAHEQAGLETIGALVARMSLAEAGEEARKANTRHGKGLTRADKLRLWDAFTAAGDHLQADGALKSSRAIVAELGHHVYSHEKVRQLLRGLGNELHEDDDVKPWGARFSEDDLSQALAEDASTALHDFAALFPQLANSDKGRTLEAARALVDALGRGEDGRDALDALRNPLGI